MVYKNFEFSNSVGLNKNIIIEKPHLGGSFWGKLFNLGVKYIPKLAEKGLPFLKKAALPFLEKGVEKALGVVSNLFGKSREKIQDVLPESLKPLGKQLIDSAEEKVNEQIRQKLKTADEAIKKYSDYGSYGVSRKEKKEKESSATFSKNRLKNYKAFYNNK